MERMMELTIPDYEKYNIKVRDFHDGKYPEFSIMRIEFDNLRVSWYFKNLNEIAELSDRIRMAIPEMHPEDLTAPDEPQD